MADIPLEFGPEHPDLSMVVYRALNPLLTGVGRIFHVHRENSRYAQQRGATFRKRLEAGEAVYLVGINSGIHNSGVCLLRATRDAGMEMLSNDEEERFTGVKHEERYPCNCVEELVRRMQRLRIGPEDIHAVITGWAQMETGAFGVKTAFEHAPGSIILVLPKHSPECNVNHVMPGLTTSINLGKQLGLKKPVPMISSPHHENHACASFALSPFNRDDNVMVTVLDAISDTGGITTFFSRGSRLIKVYQNNSFLDSLGILYSMVASALGGWKRLSSEGRLMGLSAFGDMNRESNPFYRDLRHIIRLTEDGSVEINRALLNTGRGGATRPFTPALKAILGSPIKEEELWNPDSDEVFTSDKIKRDIPEATLHKAAALQLVFEDGVFHIVDSLIRRSYRMNGTASDKLVLTGGTALNCVVNNKLLYRFDRDYYRKNFGEEQKTLHAWVPPFPGDAGIPAGAAFAFAMRNGAPMGPNLQHAFYVGLPPSSRSIGEAIDADSEVKSLPLGNIKRSPEELGRVAWFLAGLVAEDQVVGLFQGEGETGPRALGHRSILANPTRRDSLNLINQMVKRREAFRPLAPFGTLQAVLEHCEIEPNGGLSADNFNALNYMVFAVGAKPASRNVIPAVVHEDGTLRAQVVREKTDPFTYAYLKALGKRIGVEMSVNTSFNIGSAIVQTPTQAVRTLKRSKGMAGVMMIGEDGEAVIAYHEVENGLKDGGRKLKESFRKWRGQ